MITKFCLLFLTFLVAQTARAQEFTPMPPPPGRFGIEGNAVADVAWKEIDNKAKERFEAGEKAKAQKRDPQSDPQWQKANSEMRDMSNAYMSYTDKLR